MASLKRSKTMPADGQTAKFLYTILKQLDLKSVRQRFLTFLVFYSYLVSFLLMTGRLIGTS